MASVRLFIPKMNCQTCVGKIEAAFANEKSTSLEFNLANQQLTVQGVDIDVAKDLLQKAGFSAEQMDEVAPSWVLHIPKMNCGSCAKKIEAAFSEQWEGCFEVDIAKKRVTIQGMDVDIAKDLLYSAGFSAELVNGAELVSTLHIPKMNCANCVSKIEAAFVDNTAVSIKIELAKKQLTVTGMDFNAASTLIKQAGFDCTEQATTQQSSTVTTKPAATTTSATAASTSLNFYVPSMNCASCVGKIEKAFLDHNTGTEQLIARVNLADKQVQVLGEIDVISAQHLILKAGFESEQILDAKRTAAEKERAEAKEYRVRMVQAAVGLGLGVPLMLWGLLGGEMMVNTPAQQLAWGGIGALTFFLLITLGKHFYQGMWRALKAKSANMDTLIVLGTTTAWLYSMLVVVAPQWFPANTRHVYFEASVMILGLINLGHGLELRARGKTSAAVQKLLGLQSNTAVRVTDSGDEVVEINQIQLGDKLRLKPGERVALDGVVVSGSSLLNESMLTGEPIPNHKQKGDELNAGTVNGNGSLVYMVTAKMQDTRLAKIIKLVKEAQTSKMPIGRLADKISAYFVPVVVVIALLSSLTWLLLGPAPAISHALVVLTSVLIIACPCALGLATPMSIMVSVGRAASLGVLIRNGEALQTASKVSCVVLDKTGTVTMGKPQVTDMKLSHLYLASIPEGAGTHSKRHFSNDEAKTDNTEAIKQLSTRVELALLRDVACLERHSEHPLATAIVDKANTELLELAEPEQFENIQGKGVYGVIGGNQYAIGNKALMLSVGAMDLAQFDQQSLQYAKAAKTPVYVAQNGHVVAIIAISDPIKADAKKAIAAMQNHGLKVVLLTGDNQLTAKAVAAQVGIDNADVIAQVLPAQKQAHVQRLQQAGEVVAMVGDGINDAPALVSADIGMAMGTGTEVAIESADFTLLSSRLMAIADTLVLAKASMRNIKQNLFGAFFYNSLGIPLAAGALYPLTGVLLSPVIAGGAMALSSLTVVTNANRLRNIKLHRS